MEKLQNLIKLWAATTDQYGDKSTGSVTCSWIVAAGKFYVSLVRYKEAYGGGKDVVAKSMNADLDVALAECAASVGIFL